LINETNKHEATTRAGLKGRGARSNYYWKAPLT